MGNINNKKTCFDVHNSRKPSISLVKSPSQNHLWSIQVQLKDEYKQDQPFNGLSSKVVTAKILSYFGYKHQVYNLLQTLSHRSRIYCIQ